MTGYDVQAARRRRVDRQRAIRAERRRKALAIGVAGVFVIALVVAAPTAFGAVARGVRSMGPAPAAVALTPSAPPTFTVTSPLPPAPTVKPGLDGRSKDGTLTIVAVGDLLFDLSPRRMVAAKGGRAPLAKVETLLADADLTVGNLEGPLSNRGAPVAGKPAHLIFEGDPRSIESLKASSFDVLALANNHIMDHGREALEDTVQTLDTAGIAYAGAGFNTAEAWKPAIVEREGRRIAFLSYSQRIPDHFLPSATRPGLASGNERSKVLAAIRAARKQADCVIVSVHWGVEQSYSADSRQIADAHAYIDAGADAVLSHHPHVMQALEFYKGKLIAYSLGNFLFPYKTIEGRKSMILKFDVDEAGKVQDVRVTPVYLGEWGAPVVQHGGSAAGILGKLRDISAPRGARVVIDGDTARVVPK